MTYRVYVGPRGSQDIRAAEKDQWLFKELANLDDALSWAGTIQRGGSVPLLIEGDDGTRLSKWDIADALAVRAAETEKQAH